MSFQGLRCGVDGENLVKSFRGNATKTALRTLIECDSDSSCARWSLRVLIQCLCLAAPVVVVHRWSKWAVLLQRNRMISFAVLGILLAFEGDHSNGSGVAWEEV